MNSMASLAVPWLVPLLHDEREHVSDDREVGLADCQRHREIARSDGLLKGEQETRLTASAIAQPFYQGVCLPVEHYARSVAGQGESHGVSIRLAAVRESHIQLDYLAWLYHAVTIAPGIRRVAIVYLVGELEVWFPQVVR